MAQAYLEAVVQRMIDAGESEENIATVIRSAPKTSPAAPPPAPAAASPSMLDTANEVVRGAVKGAGNTVFGLGKAVRDYTPIGRISDAILPGAFDQKPPEIVPTNTAQKVGYGAEQIGEFFLPTGTAGAVGKFVNSPRLIKAGGEVAKATGLTLAQTGSPTAAGISGAITAAIPVVGGAVRGTTGALKASANKSVAQALGATTLKMKEEAAKLAPEMIQRGLGGSRVKMLERASAEVADLGQKIGAEVATAAQAGATVSGPKFAASLATSRQALTVLDAAGKVRPIPGQEVAVQKLDALADFVQGLGDDIPIDKAQTLKVAWDRIVSKAGLFGPQATASASDNAKAWAFREAAGSMRKLIASESPTLAALNQEFKFWKGLSTVLTATEKRTQAQAGGLTQAITGAAGAGAGFASGDSFSDRMTQAVLGGIVGKQLVKVVQSPGFRTQVSAPLKNALADALVSGKASTVMHTLSTITKATPSLATAQGK